nr:unnamed protein product [Callosobruchus chinensis]
MQSREEQFDSSVTRT